MDVKNVNFFIEAFHNVMPQLGFSGIQTGKLSIKGSELSNSGVIVVVGVVGEVKGNVVYMTSTEDAKKIASAMMMGMPVSELDDMAKSAISELTNMLTANAAICASEAGTSVDISTPTLMQGEQISVKVSAPKVLCVDLIADQMTIGLYIAFED